MTNRTRLPGCRKARSIFIHTCPVKPQKLLLYLVENDTSPEPTLGVLTMAEPVYSVQQVNDWQLKLDDLAKEPRTRFTKKEAVQALIEQIEKALEAHNYDQVAENLEAWGLSITSGSLKQYVNAIRRSQTPTGTRTSRRRSKAKPRTQRPSTKKAESVIQAESVAQAESVTKKTRAKPSSAQQPLKQTRTTAKKTAARKTAAAK